MWPRSFVAMRSSASSPVIRPPIFVGSATLSESSFAAALALRILPIGERSNLSKESPPVMRGCFWREMTTSLT
jgi:hypothetical protein